MTARPCFAVAALAVLLLLLVTAVNRWWPLPAHPALQVVGGPGGATVSAAGEAPPSLPGR